MKLNLTSGEKLYGKSTSRNCVKPHAIEQAL
jgi:hypothetical protein